jgi:hypothetical protein
MNWLRHFVVAVPALLAAGLCQGPAAAADPAGVYRDIGSAADFDTNQAIYSDAHSDFGGTAWPAYWN